MTDNANKLILSLDNNDEILDCKLNNGFAIWPQVRYSLYKVLLNDKVEETEKVFLSERKSLFLFKRIYYYITLFLKSPLRTNAKYDCLIFNSSVSCVKNIQGLSISKINDFFNSVGQLRVFNIFQSNNGKHNRYVKPYAYHEAINLKSALQAKFRNKSYPADGDAILKFINFLRDQVGNNVPDGYYKSLTMYLFNFVKVHYYLVSNFNKLLLQTNPLFIVVEDGNYGGSDKTTLLWCANKLNIKSVEVQHGVFDLAFKYGENLVIKNDFSAYKTSLVFTMGKYWTDYSKISSTVYPLGYPYLEEKIKKLGLGNDNTVLFISQGTCTFRLKEVALELARKTNYKIIYRLHPNEDRSNYFAFEKAKIEISDSGDIYELLAKCYAIVGSYSTVLFEALLFNKKIFVHKNKLSDEYIPEYFGFRFHSETDLMNGLENYSPSANEKSIFWSLNWQANLEAINKLEKLW